MTTVTTAPATTDTAAQTTQGRLSVAQMLRVMRVEFYRAKAQRQPLVCSMLAIDQLDQLRVDYGTGFQKLVLRGAYELLRQVTKEHGFIGMGLMSGDRVMAVFPGLPPERGSQLGDLLCKAARAHGFQAASQNIQATLSVGASHNLLEETSSFEGLVEAAGRALFMAREAGGDRGVLWREAEAEMQALRAELDQHAVAFQGEQDELDEAVLEVDDPEKSEVLDKLRAIFGRVRRTKVIAGLEREVLAVAAKELFEERQRMVHAQVAEHRRSVQNLERRLAKLTNTLGVTEKELQRVMAMKAIDPGVASIYREVQGLSGEDENSETKKGMMAEIFKANLAFQRRDEPTD